MKKNLALPLLLVSPMLLSTPQAMANTYIQFGLGTTQINKDDDTVTFKDNTRLTPGSSSSDQRFTLGYRDESLGVEVSYRQTGTDAEKEIQARSPGEIPALPSGISGGTPNEYEEEWETDLKTQQLAVKGVYFQDLSKQFTLKAGLGLTYTEYEQKSSHTQSWEEDRVGPDWEYDRVNRSKSSDSAVGGIASIAVDYTPAPDSLPNLKVGLEAAATSDKYSTSQSLYGTLGWVF